MRSEEFEARSAAIAKAMARSEHPSVNALAKAAGMDRETISRALSGEASERTYLRLEHFLGLIPAVTPGREALPAGCVEFEVSGPGGQVRLRGPVTELATLEGAAARLIDRLR